MRRETGLLCVLDSNSVQTRKSALRLCVSVPYLSGGGSKDMMMPLIKMEVSVNESLVSEICTHRSSAVTKVPVSFNSNEFVPVTDTVA